MRGCQAGSMAARTKAGAVTIAEESCIKICSTALKNIHKQTEYLHLKKIKLKPHEQHCFLLQKPLRWPVYFTVLARWDPSFSLQLASYQRGTYPDGDGLARLVRAYPAAGSQRVTAVRSRVAKLWAGAAWKSTADNCLGANGQHPGQVLSVWVDMG